MKFTEVNGDLFSVGKDYALAHCVSCDCKFGAGIALQFRNRFKGIERYCYAFQPSVGDVIRYDGDWVVFNLFTKEKYWHKPFYATLGHTLLNMKNQMITGGLTKLAIPRLGSGLDKLWWPNVRQNIKFIFADTTMDIVVFYKK